MKEGRETSSTLFSVGVAFALKVTLAPKIKANGKLDLNNL